MQIKRSDINVKNPEIFTFSGTLALGLLTLEMSNEHGNYCTIHLKQSEIDILIISSAQNRMYVNTPLTSTSFKRFVLAKHHTHINWSAEIVSMMLAIVLIINWV